MKDRKIWVAILSVLVVITAVLFVFVACASDTEDYDEVYYANYGEWFCLPYAESVEAYYANGEVALKEGGKLFVDDVNDFRLVFKNGGKETIAILKVNANVRPDIYVSQQVVFGTVNEKTALPSATANDGVSSIAVTQKVFFGEVEQDISQGFVPTQTGEYRIIYSAVSGTGKTFEKSIPMYIESSTGEWEDRILSYDKPYGTEQVLIGGGKLSYSADIKFENEAGSLRVSLASGFENELTIANAQKEDISGYDAISFYVYNDSDANLELSICWGGWPYIELQPHRWTEIIWTIDEIEEILQTIGYLPVKEFVSAEHINGLTFVYSWDPDEFVLYDDALYFSSVRGIRYLSMDELIQEIGDAEKQGSVTRRKALTIESSYNALSEREREQVTDYAAFADLYADRILSEYGTERDEDKIFYFGDEVISEQIDPTSWGYLDYEAVSDKMFNGEVTSKFSVSADNGELSFVLTRPFLNDLNNYDYVTFGVYFEYPENLSFYNWDTNSIGEKCNIELRPNEWNTVSIMLGTDTRDIKESMFWIVRNDWSAFGQVIDFYISPMYAGTGTPDMSTLYIPFDSKEGEQYISGENENTQVSFSTEVHYGDEAGSLKICCADVAEIGEEKSGQIYVNLENVHLRSVNTVEIFSLYVYNDSVTRDYIAYFSQKYTYTESYIGVIPKGEWTKIYLVTEPGKTLSDYSLWFMDGWRYTAGDNIYCSAVRHEISLSAEKLPFDTSAGELFMAGIEAGQTVSYTSEKAYGGEQGSMQVTVNASGAGQIRVNLINCGFIASSPDSIDVYELNIYYEGQQEYGAYLMLDDMWRDEVFLGELVPGQWTKLFIEILPGDNLSAYELMFHTDGWTITEGEKLYFSSMTKARTVTDGLHFDREEGVNQITEAMFTYGGVVQADIEYTDEVSYGEAAGSVRVGVKDGSSAGRLHLDIVNAGIPAQEAKAYRFYVYYEGNSDYTFYIMDKGYYYGTEGVKLKSGQWTEITIIVSEGKALEDYSFIVQDGRRLFAAEDSIYFSGTITEETQSVFQ